MQWCNSCNAASSIESQWLSKSCFWHQGILTLNPLCNFNRWIFPRITLWNNWCSSSKQYQHHGQGEAICHNSRIAYLLKKRICVIIYNWITNETHSTATVLRWPEFFCKLMTSIMKSKTCFSSPLNFHPAGLLWQKSEKKVLLCTHGNWINCRTWIIGSKKVFWAVWWFG